MNINFDVNTDKGDKIIVSLFSYPFLPDKIKSEKIEIVEISITRDSGSNVIKPKTFKKIADRLIQIAEIDNDLIYYYFCDSDEELPNKRQNKDSTVQCYRDQLFSLLFLRYTRSTKEEWSDNRIVMKSDESIYYAHFLTRKSHGRFIEIIKEEINNDFILITTSK